MSFNSGLDIERSYHTATAEPEPRHPILTAKIDADLVVIGGGCTGLSAALNAAERGLKVVLVEGGRVGWGASGRNGGQMIVGLCKTACELVKLLGRERARALFDLALEAWGLVLDLIKRHAMNCDLRKTVHPIGTASAGDMTRFEHEIECLATIMNCPLMRILSAAEVRVAVDAPYHGGLFDGGHMLPLNYTLALAQAAAAAGVMFHERSVVRRLDSRNGIRAETAFGAVRARRAVLAGHALLKRIHLPIESRIMPIGSYIVDNEPLANAAAVIPSNAAVSDTRFIRCRPTAGCCLAESATCPARRPTSGTSFAHTSRGLSSSSSISYACGGLASVTTSRLPHVGRDGDMYFAHGCSGLGVILSTLVGKLLVEAIAD
ncbi:FAD-binding oxidoreductase [Mesorhizobium sp. SARCC-RB16n]|uniref:NAD(P)/FAD-dependent oxidoreductase n=1 Tax=Mesorhizobium sp. SARCC-RB16n TaxID=2116687 RepID=UPI001FF00D97|nr:FAD-binding oxidoreductase [Mesorhizobium sp. SARCC-RB16n]